MIENFPEAVVALERRRRLRFWGCLVLTAGSILGVGLGTLAWGPVVVPWENLIRILNPWSDITGIPTAQLLAVRALRLPRFLAALGAGATLSVSGTVLQALLGNPLAEPYTLGIAAGGALGASVGLLLGFDPTLPAFAGALGALAFALAIAEKSGDSPAHLVLAGIVVTSVLSAGITLVKYLADDRASAIVFWLMGSFADTAPRTAGSAVLGSLVVFLPALYSAQDLDAMALGSDRARLLGVRDQALRRWLLTASALATALVVGSFGIIGFVGLVVPHLLRIVLGPGHRMLLPAAFVAGAALLALADGGARAFGDLPVGVLTALVGGPVFCGLLFRTARHR